MSKKRKCEVYKTDEDYAALSDVCDELKAEVERLTVERNGFQQAMKANQSILETKRDVIERLIKAGDAMAEGLLKYIEPTDGYLTYLECRANWNAAVEGKPSV